MWNKIDLLAPDERQARINSAARRPRTVAASAITGEGLDRLLCLIEGELAAGSDEFEVHLDAASGDDLAWLYRRAEVLERTSDPDDSSIRLRVRMPAERVEQAAARFGARWQRHVPGRTGGEQAAE